MLRLRCPLENRGHFFVVVLPLTHRRNIVIGEGVSVNSLLFHPHLGEPAGPLAADGGGEVVDDCQRAAVGREGGPFAA
jgi:hypothetical protein